jgi:hypothetical protein
MRRADAQAAVATALARFTKRRARSADEIGQFVERHTFHLIACGIAQKGLRGDELLAALPAAARTWFVTSVPDADVLNGGFWQLFGNSTGDTAALSIAGFIEIGSPARAELFTRAAMALFDTTDVPPQAERWVRLEALADDGRVSATIGALNRAYSELHRAQRLEELLLPYARARASDFFLD